MSWGRVVPATIGLLAGLAGLTSWSTKTDRTSDCGCYGGLVEVQPGVSVLLNAVYAALALLVVMLGGLTWLQSWLLLWLENYLAVSGAASCSATSCTCRSPSSPSASRARSTAGSRSSMAWPRC